MAFLRGGYKFYSECGPKKERAPVRALQPCPSPLYATAVCTSASSFFMLPLTPPTREAEHAQGVG